MNINKIITKVNEEKPNTFSPEKITSFVNDIESEVAEQLKREMTEYVYPGDKEVELMAPAPYDRLYISFVKAQIDYSNEEYASYANNQAQHNQDFKDFVDWIVRTNATDEDEDEEKITRFKNVF